MAGVPPVQQVPQNLYRRATQAHQKNKTLRRGCLDIILPVVGTIAAGAAFILLCYSGYMILKTYNSSPAGRRPPQPTTQQARDTYHVLGSTEEMVQDKHLEVLVARETLIKEQSLKQFQEVTKISLEICAVRSIRGDYKGLTQNKMP